MIDVQVVSGRQPHFKSVIVESGEPAGYEQITVDNTATALTVPLNANSAIVQVDSASIRWRDDGTDPTSSVGMTGYRANYIQMTTATQLKQFRAIRVTATNATLDVAYYNVK